MPTVLVRNGRVVTASDSYEADLYVDGGRIALVGQGLSLPADTVLDASGCLVLPGGIDAHTHLDMPAGELTSADDFETGTRAAAFGGTTTVVDFATPEPGESLLSALETWRRKAEGKAVRRLRLPHGRARGRRDDARRDGPPDPRRGRHLVQALPGLPRGPAGRRCGLLPGPPRGAGVRGAHPRPRGERGRHRRPGEAGPGAGRDRPPPPRSHPTAGSGGGGDRPGDRPGRDGGSAALRRPPLVRGGARPRDGGPGPRAPRLRRDLPAVPLPLDRGLRPSRLRGGEVRDVAAAAPGGGPGGALARSRRRAPAGGRDRPLPVHPGRQGARPGRLLEDPERRARHRDADDAAVGRRRARRAGSTRSASWS